MNKERFNLIIALIFSVAIIAGWQHFYERPRLAKTVAMQKKQAKQLEAITAGTQTSEAVSENKLEETAPAGNVKIISDRLHGSINLKGLRFDELTLADYYEDLEKTKEVTLFSSSNGTTPYFAEIGWVSADKSIKLPDSSSVWQTDKDTITPGEKITFSWTNDQQLIFKVTILLDEHYMFALTQTVVNNTDRAISIQPYGLISHYYSGGASSIVHEGAIGSINGNLEEYTYSKIKDKKLYHKTDAELKWLGISDKYWLSAFVPDQDTNYTVNIAYAKKAGFEKIQTDYVAKSQIIAAGEEFTNNLRLFAGAKNVNLLDKYEAEYGITLFDRAIDFGWFYIITKPLFYSLSYVYSYVGNFGLSIVVITILIKLALFGLSSKSYSSMSKLKKLQPQMARLKELYGSDAAKLHQETMALYKREKVNPFSGCLPLIVQIPIFFSLYKVLNVTLEMRHAPFYGWIKDLSAMDTSNIFNLFGLLPFTPPSMLHLGILPILVSGTMYIQQKMSPPPSDPMQAKMLQFLPLIFLFTFRSLPAGLLIYWTFSNIISVIQQYVMTKAIKD